MNVVLLILILGRSSLKTIQTYSVSTQLIDMDYQTFDSDRKKYLNLLTWDEFKATY
jgi:hypothetical protein